MGRSEKHGCQLEPLPRPICSDMPRCKDCPYPAHGFVCWRDEKNCLRTEVETIHQRGGENAAFLWTEDGFIMDRLEGLTLSEKISQRKKCTLRILPYPLHALSIGDCRPPTYPGIEDKPFIVWADQGIPAKHIYLVLNPFQCNHRALKVSLSKRQR